MGGLLLVVNAGAGEFHYYNGLTSCASIVVGYKTKFSAAIMLIVLFLYNVFTNQFWAYASQDARRDF